MKRPPLLPSDELLSAYFDGEVTPEERAAAEQRLNDDPAAATWLDELEEMRVLVHALPRYSLGDDFSAQVLRDAERAMLFPAAAGETNGRAGKLSLGLVRNVPLEAAAPAVSEASIEVAPMRPHASADLAPSLVSRRWRAPTWLAAAASLLLFIGLLRFTPPGTSRAVMVQPPPTLATAASGGETARSETAQPRAWGRGGETVELEQQMTRDSTSRTRGLEIQHGSSKLGRSSEQRSGAIERAETFDGASSNETSGKALSSQPADGPAGGPSNRQHMAREAAPKTAAPDAKRLSYQNQNKGAFEENRFGGG